MAEFNVSNFNKVRNELLSDLESTKAMDIYIKFAKDTHNVDITREELVDKIMLPIAAHETGQTFDPKQLQNNDPKLAGRGLFQYEIDEMIKGKGQQAATTALNRAANHTDWAKKELETKNRDFSKYSIGRQGALFIYDHMHEGSARMDLVVKDVQNIWDYWADHHHKQIRNESNSRYQTTLKNFTDHLNNTNKHLPQRKQRVRHIREVPPNFK
jgi:uncharacterized protein YgiM (DUF1202 family)